MTPYPAKHLNPKQFAPPRPMKEYPKDSIKNMAVLFTDIVGSSKFFKAHGDIAGRRMLKQHQDMASPAIIEHGGEVIKMLGDSVMAYFLDPMEALKSAIKIQQRFTRHNQEKEKEAHIHIRVCIHIGKGIVEEGDIFGDVVNMASKILSLVDGDEIGISHHLYQKAKDLPSLKFESINTDNKKDLFKGLPIYRVIWGEGINVDPVLRTLLFIKPIWNLGKKNFVKLWENLDEKRKILLTDKIVKEMILPDKSMVLILRDAPSAMSFAKGAIDFLRMNLGLDGAHYLPVQIFIDTGSYIRAGQLVLDDFKVNWENAKPGKIYLSSTAYGFLKNDETLSVKSLPPNEQPKPFYLVIFKDQQGKDSGLFSYQNALTQGENRPCYYCGDQEHLMTHCPSKQLPEKTEGLSKLGYYPLDEINTLFFNYVSEKNPDHSVTYYSTAGPERRTKWAFFGFYELKNVFQLRFLRSVWNAQDEDWTQFKQKQHGGDKGGLIWLGQDCIRVSNLDQAETILMDAIKKYPKDYRGYCAMGFLCVEKNDYVSAKSFFKQALDAARRKAEKIYILFLLMRLHESLDDLKRAQQLVRKILSLDPHCPEAQFQDIIYKFREDKKEQALYKLNKLIRSNKEYYIHALIDPELADFAKFVHLEVKKLIDEAREISKKIFEDAQSEFERLEKLLGDTDQEVVDARSLLSRIKQLSEVDSYYNCLDVIHYGNVVINKGRSCLEERKRKLSRILNALDSRAEKCRRFVTAIQYDYLISQVSQQLKAIEARLRKNWDYVHQDMPDKFNQAFNQADDISQNLTQVEMKLKKLSAIGQLIMFGTRFFKKSLILQSANLIIAMVLFPIIAYYLNMLVPAFQVTTQNIWLYQKIVIILGGLFGLMLAILTSSNSMTKR
ncbi:adenylate/guanylate cyclase domain-containing protein [Thermodesulfobacteriota bacterium]